MSRVLTQLGRGVPRHGLAAHFRLWAPNLAHQSESLDAAAWTPYGANVFPDQVAGPMSGGLAAKVCENGANDWHGVYQNGAVYFQGPGVTYSLGVCAKAAGRSKIKLIMYQSSWDSVGEVVFDLANGTVYREDLGTGKIYSVADGFYWCVATAAQGSAPWLGEFDIYLTNDAGSLGYQGTGTGTAADPGAYIDAVQVFPGTTLPPYEKTTDLQTFRDLSGHGYSLQRGGASGEDAADPAVLGAGCLCQGNNYAFTTVTGAADVAGTWEMLVAMRCDWGADKRLFSIGDADNNPSAFVFNAGASALKVNAFDGTSHNSGELALADATPYVFSLSGANGAVRLKRLDNGASVTAPAASYGPASATRMVLGAAPALDVPADDATFYEALLYGRNLSNAEQQQARGAVKAFWNPRGVPIQ